MKIFTLLAFIFYHKYILAYFVLINLVAVIVTIVDKYKAKNHKWRISETTLLVIAALGGEVAMYATMLIIRHKTRKLKFMLGIPLIFAVKLVILFLVSAYVI